MFPQHFCVISLFEMQNCQFFPCFKDFGNLYLVYIFVFSFWCDRTFPALFLSSNLFIYVDLSSVSCTTKPSKFFIKILLNNVCQSKEIQQGKIHKIVKTSEIVQHSHNIRAFVIQSRHQRLHKIVTLETLWHSHNTRDYITQSQHQRLHDIVTSSETI